MEESAAEVKTRFIAEAVEEVQTAIRYTEAKAAFVSVFETGILILFVAGLSDSGLVLQIRSLVDQGTVWFAALLLASFVVLIVALIVHILLTLRVLLPVARPGQHVILGDYEPKGLFHLGHIDQAGRITPSVTAYTEILKGLGPDEVMAEFAYQQLRLSYVRRLKEERLYTSFLFLGGLVIGVTIFGFLIALGGVLF